MSNNIKSNNIKSYNTNYNNSDGSLFKYKGVVFFIFLLIVGFAGYTFYTYFTSSMLMVGHSYLSEDLKNIEYLFENDGYTKEKCLDNCQKDFLCHGLTFDASTNKCYGVRSGKLRTDEPHIYAWVKNLSKLEEANKDNMILSLTKESKILSYRMLPISPLGNVYTLSFWIIIDDWYQNYTLWRNIIYQGSELNETYLKTANWGEVVNKIPKQKFGVWLAPYNNNVRIVIGTKIPYDNGHTTEHPVNQICKGKNCFVKTGETTDRFYYDLEYVDLKDINVGEPVMIAIELDNRSLSIYHNGKLRHNILLNGTPVPINGDCYIKLDKTYAGSFMYFHFWTNKVSSYKIQELYNTELSDIKANTEIMSKNN